MRYLSLIFIFATLSAHAQMQVLETSGDGKKSNITLDNAKNYQLGDSINFYNNGKLVSRGKITYITPKKTKAMVQLTHGAKLQKGLMASNTPSKTSSSKVAQQKKAPQETERRPASISNIRTSIPTSFANSTTRDLLYFPAEKSFLLNAEAGYGQSSLKLEGIPEIKQTQTMLRTSLHYSPIEKLSVGLGLGFGSLTTDAGGTSDSGSGIENPSLQAAYHFLSFPEDKLHLVLMFEISPSIGDSEDGNILRGNNLIRVGTLMGMRHGAFSWNVLPNLNYYTETKTEDPSDDSKSYFIFAVEGDIQYDFTEQWAIYAPLMVSYTGEQVAKDNSFKIKSYMSLGLGAGFKFNVAEDLNIYFDTRYRMSPSVTAESASNSFSGDESGFMIALGTNYKF
jgi:opacity protein-like surface antigen